MYITITIKSLKSIIWSHIYTLDNIPNSLNLDFLDQYKLTTLLLQIQCYDLETGALIQGLSNERPMPGTSLKHYLPSLISQLSKS